MILKISEKTKAAVLAALRMGYFEGAVEAVFAEHPTATRDDVVDTLEAMAS
jgi:hypothetical protein